MIRPAAVVLCVLAVTAIVPPAATADGPAANGGTAPVGDHSPGETPGVGPSERVVGATPETTAGNRTDAPGGERAGDRPPLRRDRSDDGPSGARIVALYPNPVAADDVGEYAVVSLPERGNWTLTDGRGTVRLGNRTGRIVISRDPAATLNVTEGPVVEAPPTFRLANAGDLVELRRDGDLADAVEYDRAPEGERWLRRAGPGWRPLGYAPRLVTAAGPTNATAFVLPDEPRLPAATIRSADERLLLAGYTFTSERVARELAAAADRGVEVRVLVEGSPVGGFTRRSAAVLDYLVEHGVSVTVFGGEYDRYAFHHAKYAVADDAALVTTENWKPAGVGGNASRGWAVRIDSPATASQLAAVFRTDAAWRDGTPWRQFRAGRRFVEGDPPATGSFPTRFEAESVAVDRVRLLTAPGNAESTLIDLIDGADERVDVVQPTIGSRTQPLLEACVRAAERGVPVRILLSERWYVADENRALARDLRAVADRRDVPLDVRIADPGGRYEKIHAKGVIADDAVAIGSANWNDNSLRRNREVAVILEGREAAAYYRRVFEADWRDGEPRLPVGLAAAVAAAVIAAVAYARRRVTFAAERTDGNARERRDGNVCERRDRNARNRDDGASEG